MQSFIVRGLLLLFLFSACQHNGQSQNHGINAEVGESSQNRKSGWEVNQKDIKGLDALKTGAEQTDLYIPLLQGKKVGVIVNQTSLVEGKHLIDVLLENNIQIKRIFAPEHGFRGAADAGETVKNNIDTKTGIPILSLYGNNKKPTKSDLEGLDIIVFDIQDVGARFYTYVSTMSLCMEACAEYGKEFMVLDRPNPNGHYVDGPVLDTAYSSYVGMHPIPVVHGMTVGEYAQMVNGEKWLKVGLQCPLQVIKCTNYTHHTTYAPPVKPSPNLPTLKSIYLYPSLCFFEGTIVSVGRGTDMPFQIFGAPEYTGKFNFSFTPESRPGAKTPPDLGKKCYGVDLSTKSEEQLREVGLNLSWLIDMYEASNNKGSFFTPFFTNLAGGTILQQQIVSHTPIDKIRKSWDPALSSFKVMRKKYLLYPE